MDKITAVKVILCEMIAKSDDANTQDKIEVLTSNIAERIVKLCNIPVVVRRSGQLVCPNCGSLNTGENSIAYWCNDCEHKYVVGAE